MKFLSIISILCLSCFQVFQSFPVTETLENPMENPNLFGGDMLGVKFDDRNGIVNDGQRWPGNVIYYSIDSSLQSHVSLIQSAMNHISGATCIRFKQRTNERDFVHLFLGVGCYSMVGRTGGQQQLSLGNGCHWLRTIVHELTHAIGFFHEQNRSDRDQYITIHLENVDPAKQSQFALFTPNQNRLFTPFDFDSVMLYGPKAFSKNGGITMVSKIAGHPVIDHPNNQGYSQNDIIGIKKLYHC